MATHNIAQNLRDNNTNWENVKQAIEDMGVSTSGLTTADYDDAIRAIVGTQPVLDSVNITPSTVSQQITPPVGTDGYDEINVAAVDNTIDANIQQQNIKSGVTILGIVGSYSGQGGNYQSKSVTPAATEQIVTPDQNYDALSQVTVAGDEDLVSSNIKKDVVIFGVTGSYEGGGGSNLDTLNVTPTANAQTITPTSPVDGWDEVIVAGDANLIANNIRKNTTIFGVTGNIEPEVSEEIYTSYVKLANTPNTNFERQLLEYNNNLYLITKDGIWLYNETNDSFSLELSYNFPFQNLNCQSGQYGAVVGDNFYFGDRNNGFELKYYNFNSTQVTSLGVIQNIDEGYRCICTDGKGLYVCEYYGALKYYDLSTGTVTTISSGLTRAFNCMVYYDEFIYGVAGDYVDKVDISDGSVTNLFHTSNNDNQDYGRVIVVRADDTFYLIGGYQNEHTIIQFDSTGTYSVIKTVTDSYRKATILIHKGIMYGSCMNWDVYDQRLRKMGIGIKKDLILGIKDLQTISGVGINKFIVNSI